LNLWAVTTGTLDLLNVNTFFLLARDAQDRQFGSSYLNFTVTLSNNPSNSTTSPAPSSSNGSNHTNSSSLSLATSKHGLPGGAIAGIVIGIVGLVLAVIWISWFFWFRKPTPHHTLPADAELDGTSSHRELDGREKPQEMENRQKRITAGPYEIG